MTIGEALGEKPHEGEAKAASNSCEHVEEWEDEEEEEEENEG